MFFFGIAKNEDRQKRYVYIEPPIYYVSDALFVRSNDFIKIESLNDILYIPNHLVLSYLGTSQGEYLKSYGINVYDYARNAEGAILMLNAHRGRFLYGNEMAIISAAKHHNIDNFIRIAYRHNISGRYLIVSEDLDMEIIERLRKALEVLEERGLLREIFEKYI